MSLRQCDKCNEMVDEAKAFCPGCGSSFVNEVQRVEISDFDQMGGTLNLGQTLYNQMLSDMGLNISKTPDAGNETVENTRPESQETPRTENELTNRPTQGPAKWIVVGGIVVFLLIAATILVLFVLRSSLT